MSTYPLRNVVTASRGLRSKHCSPIQACPDGYDSVSIRSNVDVMAAFVLSLEAFTKMLKFSHDHVMTCDAQHELLSCFKDDAGWPQSDVQLDDLPWPQQLPLVMWMEGPVWLRLRCIDLSVAGAQDATRTGVHQRVDQRYLIGFHSKILERDVDVSEHVALGVCLA
ncbi:hypothetical protein HG530_001301 [Fusarium avenaceum]|nr:hypothetical protein HG530_001301 [Fusarium avenaceum]